MAAGAGSRQGRPVLRLMAAALTCMTAFAVAAPSASAENQRPRTIFDLLFRPRSEAKPQVKKPSVIKRDAKKTAKASAKRKSVKTGVAAQSTEDQKPAVVEKSPDARVILVVGDFVAGGLAEGLTEALAANPALRVVDRSNAASGLVRNDIVDWPTEIATLAAAEKPAAIIVMVGANDRQQLKVGDRREQPLTPAWTEEYTRRADGVAAAGRAAGVPVLWVGQPSFKPMTMSNGMIALNDLFRAAAEKSGATYIDIWDGFVDASGAYAATGPDIAGQQARLRANDGINLTKAGRRKVAFYVEKPLAKLFGTPTTGQQPVAAALTPSAVPGVGLAEIAPAIDRSEPIGLDDPALDGSGELLGAIPPAPALPPMRPAPSGRADDFSAPAIVRLSPSGETAAP